MNKLTYFPRNFIKCGLTGWLLEIIWTGFLSFTKKEKKLTCHTSFWMFPIYGMASLLRPVSALLSKKNFFFRGITYTWLIFLVEYKSGLFLKKREACPWDYTHARFNLKGVIRLDYAPLWFISGLLFEKITSPSEEKD